jgi:hypothetical protein
MAKKHRPKALGPKAQLASRDVAPECCRPRCQSARFNGVSGRKKIVENRPNRWPSQRPSARQKASPEKKKKAGS